MCQSPRTRVRRRQKSTQQPFLRHSATDCLRRFVPLNLCFQGCNIFLNRLICVRFRPAESSGVDGPICFRGNSDCNAACRLASAASVRGYAPRDLETSFCNNASKRTSFVGNAFGINQLVRAPCPCAVSVGCVRAPCPCAVPVRRVNAPDLSTVPLLNLSQGHFGICCFAMCGLLVGVDMFCVCLRFKFPVFAMCGCFAFL